MKKRILVVGASLAGVRTVQALRRSGSADEIVLVGGEPGTSDGLASDRPPLSKKFLFDAAVTAPPLVTPAQLDELDTRLVHGHATDLDLDRRHVVLHGGGTEPFDTLVIATGSSPRTVPGLEPRPGVHVLRSAADATAIRAACPGDGSVVVVGGGFIGAEVAWTLHTLGAAATVVEPLPTLMVRGLGPRIGEALTRRHLAAGINLRMGVGVAGIDGEEQVRGVQLTDGSYLPTDVVVLGLGTVPETNWLVDSGLDLRDGVVCDQQLTALGAEDVYAVGDVARWRHPRYGEDVRVEHWTNAVESASVVAANLTGTPTVHDSVPYVWTDQLGGRLQVLGRVRPQDEVHMIEGDLNDKFVAVTGGDGGLQSAVGFSMARPLIRFRQLLAAGATWEEALA
ncbi:FAD-dependent oxidoreductase [Geodermatophilus sabuli]|uniref:FAD-dependent oxidoreductase n=1 Tax=Geodermatophilus sabuli TaxID=1564158 RepID=A0A7K3VYZ8_9ACTN|nr:FAD-dependent oxidoreductase [Geodermatophilus sabuli]NEK56857.1 FAD-dependent oxidoreductase [Geodermatophilus sabuli]